MKRFHLATVAALAVAVGMTALATAATPPRTATILIHHQLHGCHAWSVNGGPFRASQTVLLRRGGSMTVTNDDVMPHHLIKVSGHSVRMSSGESMPMHMGHDYDEAPGHMDHMGATTKVVFASAGTYRFKTVAGEDYMAGVHTVGPDNQLRLTVTVR